LGPIHDLACVEAAAEELRDRWNLGRDPIDDLAFTLEQQGIKVLALPEKGGFDGYSCFLNDSVPVVVLAEGLPGDRQRFTMAHEIAHLLLDVNAHLDEEEVAHRFAAAFLVPKDCIVQALGKARSRISLQELSILKHEFGVSMQALVRRAFDLGIISKAVYSRLFREFSQRGWRKNEPGKPVPEERPQRFVLLVHRALAEGLMTPSTASRILTESPTGSNLIRRLEVSDRMVEEYKANNELVSISRSKQGDIYEYEERHDTPR
jgi:Zn-dependent peptidase ImmA (M78 family)